MIVIGDNKLVKGSRVVNKGGANDTIASSPISSAIPSLNANAGDKNDHNATEPHTDDGNQNNRGLNPSSTIIASTATSTSVTSAGKKSGNNNNNPQTSSSACRINIERSDYLV